MTDAEKEPRKITGRHVFAIFATAFGIIFAVNMLLLYKAVGTFPGLEVKNSYIASQDFNVRNAAQRNLGWTPDAQYSDGKLHITITGESGSLVFPEAVEMRVGRPTHGREDQSVTLEQSFDGYWFETVLGDGKWFVYLTTTSLDGVDYSTRLEVFVTDGNG